jgi:hypothetical protein
MVNRLVLHSAALFALYTMLGGRASAGQQGQSAPPRNGTELLTRMHDAYAGKWYHTLTFVQQTTQRHPDGTEKVSTWYESLRDNRLRIDIGDPAEGNGMLYTPDSVYVVRKNAIVRSEGKGNIFLPLIEGVYIQPVDVTVAQLAPYKFDLARVRTDHWEGRPAYVVGARDAHDLESPQVWVDAERLVVTRVLVPLIPNGRSPLQDIRLEGYVRVGRGWLATRIRMLDGDVPLQTEEYADWHIGVDFPATFLQAEHWADGPHWATRSAR